MDMREKAVPQCRARQRKTKIIRLNKASHQAPNISNETNCAIYWIIIYYPLNSVIYLSNNWGQVLIM